MNEISTRLPDERLVSLAHQAVATAEVADSLRLEHEGLLPSQIDGLKEARTLYKSFNMDPSRYRPSSEALLRRVMKGKDLYRISNAVDSCNLACLRFLLPVGMYDLDLVVGDVVLRSGKPGESYTGIRKGDVNLANRLGLFDQDGPFGSPTSDSQRTCVTSETNNVLAIIMATSAFSTEQMNKAMDVFSGLFIDFCRGRESFRAVLGGNH